MSYDGPINKDQVHTKIMSNKLQVLELSFLA